MKKIKLSVAALLIAGTSFAQTNKSTQCTALTKKTFSVKIVLNKVIYVTYIIQIM